MQNIEHVYKEISKLSINEKRLILSKLISEVPVSGGPGTLDIYDLKGVGKDLWRNIDAQEYVNRERSSWE